MLRLVMPGFHPKPCADASAKNRHPYKCRFRHTPFGTLGFPFIDAIHKERHHIDSGKVNQDNMDPIQLGHYIFCCIYSIIPSQQI